LPVSRKLQGNASSCCFGEKPGREVNIRDHLCEGPLSGFAATMHDVPFVALDSDA
jgi:hypothetical protein